MLARLTVYLFERTLLGEPSLCCLYMGDIHYQWQGRGITPTLKCEMNKFQHAQARTQKISYERS